MEDSYLLVTFKLTFSYLSDIAQAYLPRNGIGHSGLGPPTKFINQEMPPHRRATDQSDGLIPVLRFLSSQVTLDWYQVDKYLST